MTTILQILAGVILGKTILNRIWPAAWEFMFGPGLQLTAISAVSSLASTLFMLVAGLEMDLDRILADSKRPLIVGFCSVLFPFVWGFGIAYAAPEAMGRADPNIETPIYAFFAGTAMAITAMPVVAKTLRDVGLYRSQFGQVVMSAATIDDLIGWSLFGIVLSLANPESTLIPGVGPGGVIGISIAFVIFLLVFGKLAFPRFFLWVQATFSFPGGILGFIMAWTFLAACGGKLIGLHNTLGAFLVGASLSNNKYLRSTTREVIDVFVTYCLSPIFFGFIAVGADFIADFDIALVAIVLAIACVGKFMGASIGARITGSSWREAFGLATCMNSRGAMEILLANVALNAGLIDGRMFVALVFMAIVTSLMPGPILRQVLRRKERKVFTTYMPQPRGFIPELKATDMEGAVRELCEALKRGEVADKLIEQERSVPSGNHDQVAVSVLHTEVVRKPKIALGISKTGIDFSGQEGYAGNHMPLSFIIIVILFPVKPAVTKKNADVTLEDDLIQQISLVFSRLAFRNEFVRTKRFLEVRQLINMELHRHGLHSTQEESIEAASGHQALVAPNSMASGNTLAMQNNPVAKQSQSEDDDDDDDVEGESNSNSSDSQGKNKQEERPGESGDGGAGKRDDNTNSEDDEQNRRLAMV